MASKKVRQLKEQITTLKAYIDQRDAERQKDAHNLLQSIFRSWRCKLTEKWLSQPTETPTKSFNNSLWYDIVYGEIAKLIGYTGKGLGFSAYHYLYLPSPTAIARAFPYIGANLFRLKDETNKTIKLTQGEKEMFSFLLMMKRYCIVTAIFAMKEYLEVECGRKYRVAVAYYYDQLLIGASKWNSLNMNKNGKIKAHLVTKRLTFVHEFDDGNYAVDWNRFELDGKDIDLLNKVMKLEADDYKKEMDEHVGWDKVDCPSWNDEQALLEWQQWRNYMLHPDADFSNDGAGAKLVRIKYMD